MNVFNDWIGRRPWLKVVFYIVLANAVVAATYGLGTIYRMMKAGQ